MIAHTECEPGRILKQSRFWEPLWQNYPRLPSVVLCRVPELEYAANLVVGKRTLDHCCGDGKFAALAWPGIQLGAGCDFNAKQLKRAAEGGRYLRTDVCDVTERLPYADGSFDSVFNNSGLEHVKDLEAALNEVARVLTKGGKFAFNLLNDRYFDWWPLDSAKAADYKEFQPFYHVLNLGEWQAALSRNGMELREVHGYFPRASSAELARLDYFFSASALRGKFSWLVWATRRFPSLAQGYFRRRIGSLVWDSQPDAGAGFFIIAEKV